MPSHSKSFEITPTSRACVHVRSYYLSTQRHSYNGILIETYTPIQGCHLIRITREIFNDMKHRAVSLLQLSSLFIPPFHLTCMITLKPFKFHSKILTQTVRVSKLLDGATLHERFKETDRRQTDLRRYKTNVRQ